MKRLGKPAFNRLGMQGLPYGFGSPSSKSYMKRILTPNADVGYDPSSLIGYWPMNESAGGVAIDHSPESNDGAYTGVTLGQPGIGDGLTCPLFDGTNDFNDIYSVGLNADFDGDEGTAMFWFRVFNVGVWTDLTARWTMTLRSDGDNYIYMYKSSTNNNYIFAREANNVLTATTIVGQTSIAWRHYAYTWSESADEGISYIDGAVVGGLQVGLDNWEPVPLAATNTVVGSVNNLGGDSTYGWIAHDALYTAPLPPTAIAYLSAR